MNTNGSAMYNIQSLWTQARENLDKARARLGEKLGSVRTVEGHGDPADAVVRQAKDEKADLCFGPFGSTLTTAAVNATETSNKFMMI